MPFSVGAKNTMLDALSIDAISAHTGDPGAAGTANEVSGGSYARQAISHAAAANGVRQDSTQPAIPIPSGNNITHLALWEGSTFRGSNALAQAVNFAADGTLDVTDADLTIADS